LLNLPATGTYGVLVWPLTGATGNVSATLSSDLPGTITVGGAPFALKLDRLGRNARLSFDGATGQTLRLSWSGVATLASSTFVTLISPSGSAIASTSVPSTGTGTYDIPVLPATGTYTLFVDPPAFVTLDATLRIAPR
jgi:hypothetical protein